MIEVRIVLEIGDLEDFGDWTDDEILGYVRRYITDLLADTTNVMYVKRR